MLPWARKPRPYKTDKKFCLGRENRAPTRRTRNSVLGAKTTPLQDGQEMLPWARKPRPYKMLGIVGVRFPDPPSVPGFDPPLSVNQPLDCHYWLQQELYEEGLRKN